jgi:hypothetical protein
MEYSAPWCCIYYTDLQKQDILDTISMYVSLPSEVTVSLLEQILYDKM